MFGMARVTNASGANDNGTPTWHERRRRDSYGDEAANDADDEDET